MKLIKGVNVGEVILVASGKGGTGKSMVTVNLGTVLSRKGYRVALVDMDMGQGCLDLYLGLQDRVVYNVFDAACGMCRIKQAVIKDGRFDCLHLVAAPPHRNDGSITGESIRRVYRKLARDYDYIIVDGPAGVDDNLLLAASGADKAVIVATPDYASVRGADTLDMVLRREGIEEIWCVLNMIKKGLMDLGGCLSFEEIGRLLRTRVVGVIPYDEIICASLNLGIPAAIDENGIFVENFTKIAGRIVRKPL